MRDEQTDAGVITALMQHLSNQVLPRALDLEKKVARGEVLDDFDIQFLTQVFEDEIRARSYLESHPEHQELLAKVAGLYRDITAKALENEKKAESDKS